MGAKGRGVRAFHFRAKCICLGFKNEKNINQRTVRFMANRLVHRFNRGSAGSRTVQLSNGSIGRPNRFGPRLMVTD